MLVLTLPGIPGYSRDIKQVKELTKMSIFTKLKIRKQQLINLLNKFGNARSLARKYAYELTIVEGKLEKLLASVKLPANRLIFSTVNVARALGINKALIQCIWQSGKDAIVQLLDGSELHVKKYDALVAMSQIRRERSRALTVTKHLTNTNGFTVRNESKDSCYRLELTDNALSCECQDYQNLKEELGSKVCCKHGYAVLNLLGYSTLKDCLAQMENLRTAIDTVPMSYPKCTDAYSLVSYEASLDY